MKLSDEQISEIADEIDIGMICYLNKDTGETIFMINDDALSDYGILWEDDMEEDEDDTPDDSSPEWQKEMYAEVKADMEKIHSWTNSVIIEPPPSYVSFKIMEQFVEEIVPEGKLLDRFVNALSRRHPFRNFNAIIHDCEYREKWFEFKRKGMMEYVREEIGWMGEE